MKKKYNINTYKFTRFTGEIVRNKTKKNPLDSVGKIPALIYEKTADKVLDRAAFNTIKSMGYKRGDNPTLGSIGYNVIRIFYGLVSFVIISAIIKLF